IAAEEDVEEPDAELGIAALAGEHQREQVRGSRSVGPFQQIFEEPLPHRRRRPLGSSEGPEAAALGRRARRALAGGDVADLLLEAGQLLALTLLELRELALALVVKTLEGLRPPLVEPLERVGDAANHAERGDERPEAVRAAEDGAGTVRREWHLVLALAPEAANRHLPLLRRRNGETRRFLDHRGGRDGGRGSW